FAAAVQNDGRIVEAGISAQFAALSDFALTRYLPDGRLDPSFDHDGRVTTDFGGNDSAAAVAIQGDGKIVAAGGGGGLFALARHRQNGSLDRSFRFSRAPRFPPP